MDAKIACFLIMMVVPCAQSDSPEARSGKELAELQGTWKLVSLEADGKATEFAEKPLRWVIKGNKVFYARDELAELTIDAKTMPTCIDLAFREPKRVYEGVYAVTGETLRICVNHLTEGVKERPLEFSTAGKPDWRLLVFKRIKAGEKDEPEDRQGYVGIAIKAIEARKAVAIGAVLDGGPAKKAGLKKDDILIQVGGEDATDVPTVVGMMRRAKPGSDLSLRIERDGKQQDIIVKVGVLPFFLLD
jgi:uncharacterized protein (TIGR03067 family)